MDLDCLKLAKAEQTMVIDSTVVQLGTYTAKVPTATR